MAMASFVPPPGLTLITPASKPPPGLTLPMAECVASKAEPISNFSTQELPALSDRSSFNSSFDDNDNDVQFVGDPSHVIFRDDESNPPLSRQTSASSISPPNPSAFDEEADELNDDLGDLPSVGSKGHADGSCTPCLFKLRGCIKGDSCLYCHKEHVKKVRARPGKTTRNKYKTMVKMVEEHFEAGSEAKKSVMELLASESKYMRTILLATATESEMKVLSTKHEAPPADAATTAALKEVLSLAYHKSIAEPKSRGQQGHDNAVNHGAPHSVPQATPTDSRHPAWIDGTFYKGYDGLTTPLAYQSSNDEWDAQIPLAVQSCWNDACMEGRPVLFHGPAIPVHSYSLTQQQKL